MKYSGIGGQAVMEGIMMRNGDRYSVGVRKPDGEIEVKVEPYRGVLTNHTLMKIFTTMRKRKKRKQNL